MISEKKHPRYAQRKIKILTDLGRELAKLKGGVDAFQKSYFVFRQRVKEVLDLDEKDPKVIEIILKDKHWTHDDINNYKEWIERITWLEGYTLRMLSDALLARYTMIVSRFDVNKHAKSILIKIVIDAMNEHLSSRPIKRWTCAHCGAVNSDTLHVFEEFEPAIFDLIGDFDFTNRFANNETRKLFSSSFLVMAPPKQYLEKRLKEETDIIGENPDGPYILHKARAAFYKEILAST